MQKQVQNEEYSSADKREAERLLCPAVRVQGLEKSFFHFGEGTFRIKDISFTLERGYMLGLIGRNGAGKSTLLRMIMQTLPRKKGLIEIGGYDVATHTAEAKKLIGYVGEDFHFLSNDTLRENGRVLGLFYPEFDMHRYTELLNYFELGAEKVAGRLSKGETTKAQLAFAIAHKPELLLLDEPTGGLDPVVRREFLNVLQSELIDERMSIIFSTHITEDLDKVADYVAMIEKGTLLFFESKEELMERLTKETGERLSLKQLMVRLCKEDK